MKLRQTLNGCLLFGILEKMATAEPNLIGKMKRLGILLPLVEWTCDKEGRFDCELQKAGRRALELIDPALLKDLV